MEMSSKGEMMLWIGLQVFQLNVPINFKGGNFFVVAAISFSKCMNVTNRMNFKYLFNVIININEGNERLYTVI